MDWERFSFLLAVGAAGVSFVHSGSLLNALGAFFFGFLILQIIWAIFNQIRE